MTTLFLGKVLSAYLLTSGIGILVSTGFYADLAKNGPKTDPMVVNISGMLHFFIGIGIVAGHFVWDSLLAVIVTLLGFGFIVRGAAYIIVPRLVLKTGRTSTITLRISGGGFIAVALLIGYLSYLVPA